MNNITICTVNYNTDNLLKTNIELLASHSKFNLTMGENTPYKYKNSHSNIKYVAGVPKEQCYFKPGNLKNKPVSRFDPGIHHALTLEKCIREVDTQYVAVFDPDFFLLEPLDSLLGYDIIGAPHGKKSIHSCDEFNLPSMDMYPGSFFCLINRDKVNQIDVDYNKYDKQYWHSHSGEAAPYKLNFIDTFYPFRQSVYKYKWASFNLCLNSKCSICKEICPPNLYNEGNPLERFFFKDKLVGLHFHIRNDAKLNIPKFPTVYHPLNNFNLL